MLYGDLVRFPLSICIKKRIIGFWYKLCHNHSTLLSLLYFIVNNITNDGKTYYWFEIEEVFCMNAISDMFGSHNISPDLDLHCCRSL